MKKVIVIMLLLTLLVGCSNENTDDIDSSKENRVYINGSHYSVEPLDGFVKSKTSSGLVSEKYLTSILFTELPREYKLDEFTVYYESLIESYDNHDNFEFVSSESISENEKLIILKSKNVVEEMLQLMFFKYDKGTFGQIYVSLPKDEYELIKDDINDMLKSIRLEEHIANDFEKNYSLDLPKGWKLVKHMPGVDFCSMTGALPEDSDEPFITIISIPSNFNSREEFNNFVKENSSYNTNYSGVLVSESKEVDINGVVSHIYYVEGLNESTNEKEYFQYCNIMFGDLAVMIEGNGMGMLSNEIFEEIISSFKFK